jgi:pseudouridine-5'-phosphate glycosidase
VAVTDVVVISDAVSEALASGRAAVSLETSVLAQGLPRPHNLEAAASMSKTIRAAGAEPAWVWVDAGRLRVGATEADLERLATAEEVMKVARRDLPMAIAAGGMGATTVSATIWAGRAAGIEVAATGGIGGVHPGSGDVSADLLELARTPGTLVCAGPKSIVDPFATLEKLEELGIGVVGYRCSKLPFFLVREAPIDLDHRADTPRDIAAAAAARSALDVESTLLVCNPIPEEDALPAEEIERAVSRCLANADREGVRGKAVTPFLLACLADATEGRSVTANLALLQSNAALAGEVAVAANRLGRAHLGVSHFSPSGR